MFEDGSRYEGGWPRGTHCRSWIEPPAIQGTTARTESIAAVVAGVRGDLFFIKLKLYIPRPSPMERYARTHTLQHHFSNAKYSCFWFKSRGNIYVWFPALSWNLFCSVGVRRECGCGRTHRASSGAATAYTGTVCPHPSGVVGEESPSLRLLSPEAVAAHPAPACFSLKLWQRTLGQFERLRPSISVQNRTGVVARL